MILVTGANGLIGSEICKMLLAEEVPFKALKRTNSDIKLLSDERVNWVIGDILNPLDLNDVLKEVDTVVHCAAMVSHDVKEEERMHQVNVLGTKNLVDISIDEGIERFIHISSVAALGRKVHTNNVTEDDNFVESKTNSAYARTKYLSELEVWRAHYEGLNTCIVNPSVVIAPGDGQRSSSKLLKYVADEKKFYTGGKLNFVDVRDVAKAVVELMNKKEISGERIILNAGNINYQKMFRQIAERLNTKPPHIKAGVGLIKLIYWADQLKFFITRIKPMVSKELLKSATSEYLYINTKSRELLGLEYSPLENTLDWACSQFKEQLKR